MNYKLITFCAGQPIFLEYFIISDTEIFDDDTEVIFHFLL